MAGLSGSRAWVSTQIAVSGAPAGLAQPLSVSRASPGSLLKILLSLVPLISAGSSPNRVKLAFKALLLKPKLTILPPGPVLAAKTELVRFSGAPV
jgi:hypothetical protein